MRVLTLCPRFQRAERTVNDVILKVKGHALDRSMVLNHENETNLSVEDFFRILW